MSTTGTFTCTTELSFLRSGALSRDNAPIEDIPDFVSAQLDFGKLADKYWT